MLPDEEEDDVYMRGRDLMMEADAEEPNNMIPLLEKLNKISAG
jgi:hypothetical protein